MDALGGLVAGFSTLYLLYFFVMTYIQHRRRKKWRDEGLRQVVEKRGTK